MVDPERLTIPVQVIKGEEEIRSYHWPSPFVLKAGTNGCNAIFCWCLFSSLNKKTNHNRTEVIAVQLRVQIHSQTLKRLKMGAKALIGGVNPSIRYCLSSSSSEFKICHLKPSEDICRKSRLNSFITVSAASLTHLLSLSAPAGDSFTFSGLF